MASARSFLEAVGGGLESAGASYRPYLQNQQRQDQITQNDIDRRYMEGLQEQRVAQEEERIQLTRERDTHNREQDILDNQMVSREDLELAYFKDAASSEDPAKRQEFKDWINPAAAKTRNAIEAARVKSQADQSKATSKVRAKGAPNLRDEFNKTKTSALVRYAKTKKGRAVESNVPGRAPTYPGYGGDDYSVSEPTALDIFKGSGEITKAKTLQDYLSSIGNYDSDLGDIIDSVYAGDNIKWEDILERSPLQDKDDDELTKLRFNAQPATRDTVRR